MSKQTINLPAGSYLLRYRLITSATWNYIVVHLLKKTTIDPPKKDALIWEAVNVDTAFNELHLHNTTIYHGDNYTCDTEQ
jgi:hypothetical protein